MSLDPKTSPDILAEQMRQTDLFDRAISSALEIATASVGQPITQAPIDALTVHLAAQIAEKSDPDVRADLFREAVAILFAELARIPAAPVRREQGTAK